MLVTSQALKCGGDCAINLYLCAQIYGHRHNYRIWILGKMIVNNGQNDQNPYSIIVSMTVYI